MKIIFASLIIMASSISYADYTNSYIRSNGTYVNGYNHSHADSSQFNNYSTVGNTNPYTGQAGTHQPTQGFNSYGSPNRPGLRGQQND